MAYEDKILDFLAQPENLGVAMQIAEYVQKLREKTHRGFWPMFNDAIKDRLDATDYGGQWIYVPQARDKWRTRWGEWSIRPAQKSHSNQRVMQAAMQQSTIEANFRLLLGACWTSDPKKGVRSPAFDQLVERLKEMQLVQSNSKWPGWNWLDYQIRSEKFILRASSEPYALVNEIADTFWQFFLDIRPWLEAVNDEVRS